MLATIVNLFGGDKRGGKSWCLKHRSRGDAPMTCIGIIVLVIGLGIGGYYYFWHNRALERAGEDIAVVKNAEQSSINAYRMRVRDRLIPAMERINGNARKACKPVITGKDSDSEEVLKALSNCNEEMHEFISDVNGTNCPTKFTGMQKNIALCCGHDWKAVMTAKKAHKTDDAAVKKQLIEECKKELAAGNKAAESARMQSKDMFKI